MSGAPKSDAAGAPPVVRKPKEATDEKVGFVVAKRRSVRVGGKLLGPGEPVDLPSNELQHLKRSGFIVLASDGQQAGGGVRVGGLQIRGGRKPGGTIA